VERAVERGGIVSYKRNADGSQSPYELNINYLDALSSPGEGSEGLATQLNRFLTSQAIMLSLAGIPGIYFHSLFGSRGDRTGADASGIPRRINREKSSRAELERDLADAGSLRARILGRYARLLRVRRSFSAFHPGGRQEILANDDRIFAVLRLAPNGRERVLCLHNVTGTPLLFSADGLEGEQWTDLIGGKPCAERADSGTKFALEPYQSLWASPLLIR
jgi:hypothetical protein